jgi:hypothetical protein
MGKLGGQEGGQLAPVIDIEAVHHIVEHQEAQTLVERLRHSEEQGHGQGVESDSLRTPWGGFCREPWKETASSTVSVGVAWLDQLREYVWFSSFIGAVVATSAVYLV